MLQHTNHKVFNWAWRTWLVGLGVFNKYGLELNSAGLWPSRNCVSHPWCRVSHVNTVGYGLSQGSATFATKRAILALLPPNKISLEPQNIVGRGASRCCPRCFSWTFDFFCFGFSLNLNGWFLCKVLCQHLISDPVHFTIKNNIWCCIISTVLYNNNNNNAESRKGTGK